MSAGGFVNDLLRRNGEYPAFDGLGSARAETNSSGTATATQDFDAFGNTIASSGSTSSPYNFAAGWAYASLACPERSRGGDAGLQHVGARYYDPQVGRFASRDSMLDQIPYAYCGGEPNDFVDVDGRQVNWKSAWEATCGGLLSWALLPLGGAGMALGAGGGVLVGDITWDIGKRYLRDLEHPPVVLYPSRGAPWPVNRNLSSLEALYYNETGGYIH